MTSAFKHILTVLLYAIPSVAIGCTSAIVAADLTRDGHMLLWKHRDTSAEQNVVARIAPTDSTMAYVALFNAADTCRREAWIGMNEAGLAVMNTASYNLAPDTARLRDREGIIMSRALQRCHTVEDFRLMLDSLPRPMGIQANFGVIDATGAGVCFEAWDNGYREFDIAGSDTPGLIVRTNYSTSGAKDSGFGYIREANALTLLKPHIDRRDMTAATFTEELSRSFYHSLARRDFMDSDDEYIVDQDFIPRYSSTASVVIEAIPSPDGDGSRYVMWCALGYPPCTHVLPATIDSVDTGLRADAVTGIAPQAYVAAQLKALVFPITRGSGNHYIHLPSLREVSQSEHAKSIDIYNNNSHLNDNTPEK